MRGKRKEKKKKEKRNKMLERGIENVKIKA